jgi:uncharacterized protein (TIGR01244 family)
MRRKIKGETVMQERMKLNEQLTVGAQPSAEQLQELKQQGFKSVVNLRTAGEAEQPLSPQQEGEKVQQLGMQYLHIPVSPEQMRPELVNEFRRKLDDLPAPVYVHCQSGMRAGAFSMMHMAVENGMSGEQTIDQAMQMGFECDKPEIKKFVQGYIDSHSKNSA